MLNILPRIQFEYMPKTSKVKKKVRKTKTKISKTYIPKETEKYMCEKHKVFFRMKLQEWKKELVRANNEALYNGSMDDNSCLLYTSPSPRD